RHAGVARAAQRATKDKTEAPLMNAPAIPDALAPPVDRASQERVARVVSEFLDARCPTTYTWSYEASRHDLRALYEKAKGEQWDGRTYLAWDTPVDPGDETVPD